MAGLPNGKMKAWILLGSNAKPITFDGRVPVYWFREPAKADSARYGGTVRRVELAWNPDDLGDGR